MQGTLYELLINFRPLKYPLLSYITPTDIEPSPNLLQVSSVFLPRVTILPLHHTDLQP